MMMLRKLWKTVQPGEGGFVGRANYGKYPYIRYKMNTCTAHSSHVESGAGQNRGNFCSHKKEFLQN